MNSAGSTKRRACAAGLTLAGLLLSGPLEAREPTIKDQRLAACYDDMVRLCPGEPDKAKLKTCIRPRRSFVSARCRAWLDKPE